jgi:hypothetical protein
MSIKVMSKVWDNTTQKSNKLLMLLALADSANDAGYTYPSINTLAKKVRVNRRNAQKIIDALESEGEVVVFNRVNEHETQLHASNLYHLPKYAVEKGNPPDLKGEFRQRVVSPETLGGSVARDTRVVSPETPDPSIETSGKEKDSASGKESDAGSVRDSQDSQTSQHVPPKKTRQRKPNPVFDPIFDEIQKQFWNTTNGYGEHEDRQAQGGRIAKIAHWHCGKSYKGIRNIGKPATSENVDLHVKAVRRFREWLKETKNGITIHDLGKYVENYYEWRDTLIAQRFKVNGAKPKDWGAHEHTWYLDEGSQA